MDKRYQIKYFTINTITAGMFIGVPVIAVMASQTFIWIDAIVHGVLIGGAVMVAGHYLLLRHTNRFFPETVAYCVAGVGTLVAALVLVLNWAFAGPDQATCFPMSATTPAHVKKSNYNAPRNLLPSDSLAEYGYIINLDKLDVLYSPKTLSPQLCVIWAEGFFGMAVYRSATIQLPEPEKWP